MRTHTSATNRERGFTLIELMVVAIVFAVLSAVSVPIYLNHRAKADVESVRKDAEQAALALTSRLTGSGTLPATLNADNPNLWGYKASSPNNRLIEYAVAEDRFRICILNVATNPDAWAVYASATEKVTSGTGTEPTGACDGDLTGPALAAEPTRGASTPIPTPTPTAIPTITPPAPGAPTGLSATTVLGENQARLSWSSVTNATGYRVYVDGSGTPAWSGTSVSATIGGLANGSHTFRVSAQNTNGESAQSTAASATIDSNDHVAAADPISAVIAAGTSWTSADYSNATATTQTGETTPNARTLWWRLTPTTNATYTFDVIAPASGTIPASAPTLTVWRAASGSTTVPTTAPTIAARGAFNPAGSQTSSGAEPIVTVESGYDYLVRVAYPGSTDTGMYRLQVTEGPAADMLATPVAITQPAVGGSNTVNAANTYAGAESGEPADDLSSMWFRTTKTTAGDIKIDVTGAGFTPVITVWNNNATTTGALGAPLAKTTGTTLTLDDSAVALNADLRVRISATGTVRGGYAVKMSTISAAPPAPSCASGVTYNGPGWQPTDVSWTVPAGATSTTVYLINADNTEAVMGTTSGNSVAFPAHVRDGRYKGIRIVPRNATGAATGCPIVVISTYVLPCPTTYVVGTNLEWQFVPGMDHYRIYSHVYTVMGQPNVNQGTTTNHMWGPIATSKYEYMVVAESARYSNDSICPYTRYGSVGGGGGGGGTI